MSYFSSFVDEITKIASAKSTALGAVLGGALGAGRGAMQAWERSIDADAKDISDAKKKALLKREIKKALVSTGIGAATGGLVGHFGNRAYEGAVQTGAKAVTKGIEEAATQVPQAARRAGFEAVRGAASALNPFKKAP